MNKDDLAKLDEDIKKAAKNSKYSSRYRFIPIRTFTDTYDILTLDRSIEEKVISGNDEFMCNPKAILSDNEEMEIIEDIKNELSQITNATPILTVNSFTFSRGK